MSRTSFLAVCLGAVLCGCTDSSAPAPPKKEGIIGKTTQEIGKADPNAPAAEQQVVSDQKINATNPITAPLAAYGPIVERISMQEVDYAVRIFEATEGRYPKDYDEFMEKIVKANNIRLPVLPFGGKYQYNEQSHSLEIVRSQEDDAKRKTAQ